MKDIYEMLNDVKTDMDDFERMDFSEFEKKNIYKHLQIKRKKTPKRTMVAAVVILCVLGIAIPVTAKVVAYVNGNIKTNFKEKVDEEFTPVQENTAEPEDTAEPENTEGMEDTEDVVAATDKEENVKASLEADGVEIRIADVSRHDRKIDVIIELTFKEDIDVLVKACEESYKLYDNLFNPTSESPFKNCSVAVNGKDENYYYELFLKNPTMDIHDPWSVRCINIGAEGKTLHQKIEITDWEGELAKGKQDIDIIYKDIQFGDKVLKGEWTYRYVFDSDRFPDEDLEKTPIELSGIDSYGDTWELTDYAITQTGLVLYGMWHEKYASTKYSSEEILGKSYAQRIHVTDNLGNEYLMYGVMPTNDQDIGNYDESPTFMQEEGKIYDIHTVYELYTGAAIDFQPEKNYLREWDENATEFTIVFEEEIANFTPDGKTFLGNEYAFYSESITIKIPK